MFFSTIVERVIILVAVIIMRNFDEARMFEFDESFFSCLYNKLLRWETVLITDNEILNINSINLNDIVELVLKFIVFVIQLTIDVSFVYKHLIFEINLICYWVAIRLIKLSIRWWRFEIDDYN